MYDKLWKELERILDFYSIVHDRDAIMNELFDVVNEAYEKGWSDAKDDSEEEAYLRDDGNWAED